MTPRRRESESAGGAFEYAGRTFANGRYQLVGLLGRGGFGTVYKAYDRNYDLFVALKLIDTDVLERDQLLRMFDGEAKTARRLEHPGIIRICDYDPNPDEPYIVMSLVEGGTLRERLAARGTLPWQEVQKIGIQVAEALHYAHQHGVHAHRDIKPANIFCTASGDYQVGDFGIARTVKPGNRQTQSVLFSGGTSGYMAPEQLMASNKLDARCDVFALGVVLYEALTGKLPYRSITLGLDSADDPESTDRILQATFTAPKSIRQLGLPIPPGLERAIDTALKKEPEKRFQSCAEFEAALSQEDPKPSLPRWIAPAAALIAAACVAGYAYYGRERQTTPVQETATGAPVAPVGEASTSIAADASRAALDAPPGADDAQRLHEQELLASGVAKATAARTRATDVRAQLVTAGGISREADELLNEADARLAEAETTHSLSSYELAFQNYETAAGRLADALGAVNKRAAAKQPTAAKHIDVATQSNAATPEANAELVRQAPQPSVDPARCQRDPFASGCPKIPLTVEAVETKKLN